MGFNIYSFNSVYRGLCRRMHRILFNIGDFMARKYNKKILSLLNNALSIALIFMILMIIFIEYFKVNIT
jgi:hypothetical protein